MVLAITGFATRILDFGLTIPTVQRPRISREEVSALFWLNTAFGALLAGLVIASSSLLASFFGDGRVSGVAIAIAVTLVGGILGALYSVPSLAPSFQAIGCACASRSHRGRRPGSALRCPTRR